MLEIFWSVSKNNSKHVATGPMNGTPFTCLWIHGMMGDSRCCFGWTGCFGHPDYSDGFGAAGYGFHSPWSPSSTPVGMQRPGLRKSGEWSEVYFGEDLAPRNCAHPYFYGLGLRGWSVEGTCVE